MSWFRELLHSFRKNIRLQLGLSAAVLGIYFSYYYGVHLKTRRLIVAIVDGAVSPDAPQDDQGKKATPLDADWLVLVLNPEFREPLWDKYDKATEEDREDAFKAVLIALTKLPPDQALNLTEGLIRRSGYTRNSEHLKKLLDVLRRLAAEFPEAVGPVAGYALRSKNSKSLEEKESMEDMLADLAEQLQTNPAIACLRKDFAFAKDCARELARSTNPKDRDHLWKYAGENSDHETGVDALKSLAEVGDPRPKAKVDGLLHSSRVNEVRLALHLIRVYGLNQYTSELEKLDRQSANEVLSQDFRKTSQQLNSLSLSGTKGQRQPGSR